MTDNIQEMTAAEYWRHMSKSDEPSKSNRRLRIAEHYENQPPEFYARLAEKTMNPVLKTRYQEMGKR